ncbi:MAG: hypothetical protein EP330_23835 [Deltaproteobacteria bacterium]|nr:MAG: hypothetical protein EP330_23835 [Deltaproteobacteria bacterium]
MRSWFALALAACAPSASETALADSPDHFVLAGGTVVGQGVVDVEVRDGLVVAVGAALDAPARIDVSGQYVVPAFIDSHVHFAYDPRTAEMRDGGVVAAVDWAAPERFIGTVPDGIAMRWSGPMVTAIEGYPTTSWGADGYGIECADATAARAAVDRLADAGAAVIKVPLDGAQVLDDASVAAVVEQAHARGLKVGAHALTATAVARAATAGVDLLVHAPLDAIDPSLADDFEAVILTIDAFNSAPIGASPVVADNVQRLRAGGAVLLYGTDFGNARATGISADELQRMVDVGLTGADILAAGTSAPATWFGFEQHGAIAPGKAASLLVLDADPLVDPLVLARPDAVYVDGVRR